MENVCEQGQKLQISGNGVDACQGIVRKISEKK